MIDEIVKSTREASAVLDRIKSMPCEGLEKEVILPLLRNAVNLKLMIQEDTQTDIRKLFPYFFLRLAYIFSCFSYISYYI